MALPVQATLRTAMSSTLRFLGREMVRAVKPLSFMDQATAWWGCRAAPITTPSRARLQRHPERAVPEEAQAILAAGLVAHVGFVERGQPYVIPIGVSLRPGHAEHPLPARRSRQPLAAPPRQWRLRRDRGDADRRVGLLSHRVVSLGE